MDEKIHVDFTAQITPVEPLNSDFTLCKCYVLYTGKNNNDSFISKEAVDDALPTMANSPVVGFLYPTDDGAVRMGGHEIHLVKDTGKLVRLTVPYGTNPETNNAHYEIVNESGVNKEYLVVDVILWTGRYPELQDAIYSDGVWFAQSAELKVLDGKRKDGVLYINKFEFSALCLLGKSDDEKYNNKPCFPSASVQPYVFSDAEECWTKLFSEFKEELNKYSADIAGKGGKMDIETIKKIMVSYGLSEDAVLPFETDGMSEEDLRAKLQEVYTEKKEEPEEDKPHEGAETPEEETAPEEPAEEPAKEDGGEEQPEEETSDVEEDKEKDEDESKKAEFALAKTYHEKAEAICKVLCEESVCDATLCEMYSLIDFDDQYVYAHHFVGDANGENENTVRIPYVCTDCEAVLDFSRIEFVRQIWVTKEEDDKIEADRAQLNALIQYKADREQRDKEVAYSAALANFSDLSDVDEYKLVVKDAMAYGSVEELTEKLYAIRGKYMTKKPAKKPLDTIHIPVAFGKKNKQSEAEELIGLYLHK